MGVRLCPWRGAAVAWRPSALARDVASWWCASWRQRLVAGCTTKLHLRAGLGSSDRVAGCWRPCWGYPQGTLGGEGFHSTGRPVEAMVGGRQPVCGRPGVGDAAGFANEGELQWWCSAVEVKFRWLGAGVRRRRYLDGVALAAVSTCCAKHVVRQLVCSGRKPSPAFVWWSDDNILDVVLPR
jgi:hypothetical protein